MDAWPATPATAAFASALRPSFAIPTAHTPACATVTLSTTPDIAASTATDEPASPVFAAAAATHAATAVAAPSVAATSRFECILFACIHTAISACVLIFLGRSTANSYRPVRPTCLPALANSFFSLMARAITTSVQMMWMYVSAASLSDGLMDEQRGSWLYFRLLLTWALLLTLGGSAATVHLLSWREMLAQPSHPFGEGATGAPRLCSGRWCRGAATELILLCERVLSFVTAWAWTDVFFAWGAQPSGWLTVKDIGIAVTLTLVTILWLASVGGSLAVNAAFERSQIELLRCPFGVLLCWLELVEGAERSCCHLWPRRTSNLLGQPP